MKKVSLLVLFCMLASIVLTAFAGCNGEHTHAYGNDWQMDKTNHFKVCACGEKTGTAAHADTNNDEACDTCGITMSHTKHSFDTNVWAYDATNHYHACSECAAKDATALHADENNDGACDVCAVIMKHDHVFDPAWTSDATDHWHAPLCGHTVEVQNKAAHTPDAFGVCTVCGHKAGEPDVSTVEKALALAALAQNKILGGKYTLSSDYSKESASFECAEGYMHILSDYANTYVTKNEDGTVCFVKWVPDDFATVEKASVNVNALNGPAIDLQNTVGVEQTVYGLLDLIGFFYEDYTALAKEDTTVDMAEVVADGVYTFSYDITIPVEWGDTVYSIAASFTLDAENYFIDSATVTMNGDMGIYTLSYDQWIAPSSDHTVTDITPTDPVQFSYNYSPLVFTDGVTDPIFVTLGWPTVMIKIEDFTGTNALVEALGIQVAFTDATGADYYSAGYVYDAAEKYLNIACYNAGSFNAVITVGAETYTIPVEASYDTPYPEDFVTNVYDDNTWTNYPTRAEVVYVGQNLFLNASVPEGCEPNAYDVTIAKGPASATIELAMNEGMGEYWQYPAKTYIFNATAPGMYTVEFASYYGIAKTMTIVVIEAPTAEAAAQGKWEIGGMAPASVNFYPTDDTKGVAVVTAAGRGASETVIFTYYIHEGEFVATPAGQTGMMIQSLSLNSAFDVVINEGGMGQLVLAKTADTADAWEGEPLPEAPGYVDPNAPKPITAGPDNRHPAAIHMDALGNFSYTTTIAASSTGYFVIYNPAFTDVDWNEDWKITVSVVGDVTVKNGPIENAAFDGNAWAVNLNLQNEGVDDAEVIFTIAVTGPVTATYVEAGSSMMSPAAITITETGTTAYTTTVAAESTGYIMIYNPAYEIDESWYENWVITIVVEGDVTVLRGETTNVDFTHWGGIEFFLENTGAGEAIVNFTVTVDYGA